MRVSVLPFGRDGDGLIFVCIQEDARLSKKRAEKAHWTITPPSKKNSNIKGLHSRKRIIKVTIQILLIFEIVQNKGFKKQRTCFFCKRKGHFKVDYYKFKAMKGGNNISEDKPLVFAVFKYL